MIKVLNEIRYLSSQSCYLSAQHAHLSFRDSIPSGSWSSGHTDHRIQVDSSAILTGSSVSYIVVWVSGGSSMRLPLLEARRVRPCNIGKLGYEALEFVGVRVIQLVRWWKIKPACTKPRIRKAFWPLLPSVPETQLLSFLSWNLILQSSLRSCELLSMPWCLNLFELGFCHLQFKKTDHYQKAQTSR